MQPVKTYDVIIIGAGPAGILQLLNWQIRDIVSSWLKRAGYTGPYTNEQRP